MTPAETELYLAATALVNTYIRVHPELAIVQVPVAGQARLGYFKDDGAGRLVLGDTGRDYPMVVLDLRPWVAKDQRPT